MIPQDLHRLGTWLLSGDTGISSETMAGIALGGNPGVERLRSRCDAPHDPSAFGRCYRLVQAVPSIRDDFDRIGASVPAFAGILREWDNLCSIYVRDLPTGESTELYECIKTLRKEGGAA